MMGTRRKSEAVARFEERRRREREAPRLRERVPNLASLRFDIVEAHGATQSEPKHARIIMVDTSPALFTLSCADRSCRDGGHEITTAVMRGLLDGHGHFTIDQRCEGTVGSAACGRDMHVEVTATFREP